MYNLITNRWNMYRYTIKWGIKICIIKIKLLKQNSS